MCMTVCLVPSGHVWLCCVSVCLDGKTGVWAVRVDQSRGQATLRSLVWPGFFAYHDIGTASFGGAYFGDGQRNNDIGFMI